MYFDFISQDLNLASFFIIALLIKSICALIPYPKTCKCNAIMCAKKLEELKNEKAKYFDMKSPFWYLS